MENNEEVTALFQKYLRGDCNDDDLQRLIRYFNLDDKEDLLRAHIQAELMDQAAPDPGLSGRIQGFSDRVGKRLIHRINQAPVAKGPRIDWYRLTRYVAAVLLVAGVAYWFMAKNRAIVHTVHVPNGKVQRFILPDSSVVWLNGGTTLSYPAHFAKRRRAVKVENGQAFFEVSKDPQRPFIVQAGNMDITVLGTSFEVEAYFASPSVTVSVRTGKVKIDADNLVHQQKGTVLNARQSARIWKDSGEITQSQVKADDIAGWMNNRLIFVEKDFSNVLIHLERHYNVRFRVHKPGLLTEKITLRLDNQPLPTVLAALAFSNQFTYQFSNDSTIIIR